MNKAVILHGTLGSPEGNWFMWLKSQLESRGFEVWLPQLPNPERPNLMQWIDFITKNCPFPLDKQTLLIGHSSGGSCALLLAGESEVGAVACVSAFHENAAQWEPNTDLFSGATFNWENLKKMSQRMLLIHSDTDPYVELEQAQFIAAHSAAELLVVPNQGHFNLEQSSDYKAFPFLIEALESRNLL